jgi:hypothetical protein
MHGNPNQAYFFEEAKHMVNGQVVEDKAIETAYDGSRLHVTARDKNKISHAVIKDKELGKLLTQPASELDLLERLKRDFKKVARSKTQARSERKGKTQARSERKGKTQARSNSKPQARSKHKSKPTISHKQTRKRSMRN